MSMLPGHLRAAFAQARNDHDYYCEPAWCVTKLFDAVTFEGRIFDSCCGGGNIPIVARSSGYVADGSDIVDRGFGRVQDFFTDHKMRDNIVSNPPYDVGEQFVLHALSVARRKVAVIMRITFLNGQGRRRRLFEPHPPAEVLVLSKRPSMPPGGTDVPAKSGTAEYIWCCWQSGHTGPPTVRWLP